MMVERLQTGNFVGGFRLDEELALSSTAAWWRVSCAADKQALLMKIPRTDGRARLINFATFEVEQMILSRLSGPDVPRLVAAGTWERPFLVLELISGNSLCEQLSKVPLSADRVVSLGSKLALALHNVHRQHVVHLDIKPSNVMLDKNGTVKIIDFGFSRHLHLPDVFQDEPVAPRNYLAPEQLLGRRDDPRSDIFSLGAMLYFFLTGRQPFDAQSAARKWRNMLRRNRIRAELRRILDLSSRFLEFKERVTGLAYRADQHTGATPASRESDNPIIAHLADLYCEPIPPRSLTSDCPAWLQEIILRSLEVDPNERHATAAHLANDLTHPQGVHITSRGERLSCSRHVLR